MALYITCADIVDAESLFRLVVVDSDGNPYVDCGEYDSWEDIFRQIVVLDDAGNPALAVYGVGAGGGGHMEFTTTLNQVAFDTTGTLTLTADYKVFVDGVFQSGGHARVGNVVTFTVPFAAGHEVSIQL